MMRRIISAISMILLFCAAPHAALANDQENDRYWYHRAIQSNEVVVALGDMTATFINTDTGRIRSVIQFCPPPAGGRQPPCKYSTKASFTPKIDAVQGTSYEEMFETAAKRLLRRIERELRQVDVTLNRGRYQKLEAEKCARDGGCDTFDLLRERFGFLRLINVTP